MGPCSGGGCERQLYRGDIFFTPLDGKTYCVDCWEKVPGIDAEMHRYVARSIAEVKQYHAEIKQHYQAVPTSFQEPEQKREQVWDGEFPT